MIHYKLPCSGVDAAVLSQQRFMHDALCCLWKIDRERYQCYGRVYKNPIQGGGYHPEVYRGDGEYREVLLDDRYAAMSFFGVGDTRTAGLTDTVANIHIVFFVHLGAIASLSAPFHDTAMDAETQITASRANPGRADEEAREAVQSILGQNMFGFTLQQIVTGPPVLAEYQIRRNANDANALAEFDMHPFHTFRINGTMKYPNPLFNQHY